MEQQFNFNWTKHEKSGFWWKLKYFTDDSDGGILFATLTNAADPNNEQQLFNSSQYDFDMCNESLHEAIKVFKMMLADKGIEKHTGATHMEFDEKGKLINKQ